jgi:hypothetical protein
MVFAIATFYFGLQTGLSPGLWIWKWLQPDANLASLGSMIVTTLAIDSVFCFTGFMLLAFVVDRTERGNK